jgi:hypothetical protein
MSDVIIQVIPDEVALVQAVETEVQVQVGSDAALLVEVAADAVIISAAEENVCIVEVGIQGPEGIPGTSDAYASRLDISHNPIIYAGESVPGATEDASVWRLWRVDSSVGTIKTWADGDALFDNKWTDRLIKDYS